MQNRKRKEELNKQRSSQLDAERVTIHCRSCKTFMCKASNMLCYSNHYICIDADFRLKVKFRPTPMRQRNFGTDTHIG
jgi:hypothetical protein